MNRRKKRFVRNRPQQAKRILGLDFESLEQRHMLAPVLYAHDSVDRLFTVDVETGQVEIIGRMGVTMYDVAFDATGDLYGVSSGYRLYRIDPSTAATSMIGNVGGAVNSLVFSPDGVLYGAGSTLYKINVSTGAGTPIGSLSGYDSAGDLAFDASGRFFMSSTSNHLVQVNPTDGTATQIGSIGFSQVLGMAFGSDNVMYGLSNYTEQIFSINLATGSGTLTANFGGQGTFGVYGGSFRSEASPNINVLGNGVNIHDGETFTSLENGTDFGQVDQGAVGVSQTFTVQNNGRASLTTSSLFVPDGFLITEGLDSNIAVGAFDTFTVTLDSKTLGTKTGEISFATNVSGKNPFNFSITGVVTPPTGPIVVTNTADSGNGSLRQAILDANARPGSDTIKFNLPGGGVQTITPLSALPVVTDSVIIDGTTQTGYSGSPLIQLVGTSAGDAYGLKITAGNSQVKGLAIGGFIQAGIVLSSGDGNIIAGNYIGTDSSGNTALGNGYGVWIVAGSSGNRIGTNGDGAGDSGERNIISGNQRSGVYVEGALTTANIIAGNHIGTNAAGTSTLGNSHSGVWINEGSSGNRIGTDGSKLFRVHERNVIAGNGYDGVVLEGLGTNNNIVAGNFIGTDVTGNVALGGNHFGVLIKGGAQSNRIGTDGNGVGDAAERNVISGNEWDGVLVTGAGTEGNSIAGNFIGVSVDGNHPMPNNYGIRIEQGAKSNRIGTLGDSINGVAERNVISGNRYSGVYLVDPQTSGNVIAGNYIGTNAAGTSVLGNQHHGVLVFAGSNGNRIGTDGNSVGDFRERNVISGNGWDGIVFEGTRTNDNIAAGNFIGTDATGLVALGGNHFGVLIKAGAQSNRVGTNGNGVGDIAERNIISGNALDGVFIADAGTSNNTVAGNFIGVAANGFTPISNNYGIKVDNGAAANVIGTNGDGKGDIAERNVISGNRLSGILINSPETAGNIVAGNYIGVSEDGLSSIPNPIGVEIVAAKSNTIGGTIANSGNLISGNSGAGVNVRGGSAQSNRIIGNSIFANDGLGIDLNHDGVTLNDSGDVDVGPNRLQNFPLIQTASVVGTTTTITGNLSSLPNTTFRLEFFSNETVDGTGFGEGQTYLGFTNVTTNASGTVSWTHMVNSAIPLGNKISATATDPDGNTSEFSQTKPVVTTGTLAAKIVGKNLVLADVDSKGKDNDLSISVLGSNLVITDANEQFSTIPAGGILSNGNQTLIIPAGSIAGRLLIDAAGGNDRITVESLGSFFPEGLAISGGDGNDTIKGNKVNRPMWVSGDDGNDFLGGGMGNDRYYFDTSMALGIDTLDDAGGIDALSFSSGGTGIKLDLGLVYSFPDNEQVLNDNLSLRLLSPKFENVLGTSDDDTIIGNSLNNLLRGGGGNDTYLFNADTAQGTDIIDDSGGWDRLDFLGGDLGVKVNLGVLAVQDINANMKLKLLTTTAIELVAGSSGHDRLIGNSLRNRIIGGPGNDQLVGGRGSDDLMGGVGNDRYVFDVDTPLGLDKVFSDPAGIDFLDFLPTSTNRININLGTPTAQIVAPGFLTLDLDSSHGIEGVRGGGLDDFIIGNDLANILLGMGGNDQISGAGEDDVIIGGGGADSLGGDSGDDLIIGGAMTYDYVSLGPHISILGVWDSNVVATRHLEYANRLMKLRAGIVANQLCGGVTVLDDAQVDTITGGTGRDWYFAYATEVTDKQDNESLEDWLDASPNLVGTIFYGDVPYPVKVNHINGESQEIVGSENTWIVIHGKDSKPSDDGIHKLALAIDGAPTKGQVLVVDWGALASSIIFFDGAKWIPHVAAWVGCAVHQRIGNGTLLNLVGHSWGTYVAAEIAKTIPGGVNSIVALDPALDVPGGVDLDQNDFRDHAKFSWAFFASAFGSTTMSSKAHESFALTYVNPIPDPFTRHSQVVDLFANMQESNNRNENTGVSRYFSLTWLLIRSRGPWKENMLTYSGVKSEGAPFEAKILVDFSGTNPVHVEYFDIDQNDWVIRE